MKKVESLRAWILQANPGDIANRPDSLVLFVEKGAMACRNGPGLGFEYRYTLQVGVTDFAADTDALMVPILAWVSLYQPELLADYDTSAAAVRWSAEMLDATKVDMLVELDLTESVRVTPRADGSGYDVEHLDEVDLSDGRPRHWTLYVQGQDAPIAEWDAPDE